MHTAYVADACTRVCESLVAGRHWGESAPSTDAYSTLEPLDIDEWCLRSALVGHRLSGIAVRAVEGGRLIIPRTLFEAVSVDWAVARRWSRILDLESGRIGRAALECSGGSRPVSPPILLKGPAVARRYQDPSVRTYSDIDLLVPPDEILSWVRLLRRLGFSSGTPWQERTARLYSHHIPLWRWVGGEDSAARSTPPSSWNDEPAGLAIAR